MYPDYKHNTVAKWRQHLSAVCLAVFLLAVPTGANGQAQIPADSVNKPSELNVWSSNGPNAGILSVAVDPTNRNIIYAGGTAATGSLYKSINNGASWNLSNTGLEKVYVQELDIDPANPNTIYAKSGGVFKSTNGGASWNQVLTADFTYSLAIAPSNPNTLYVVGIDFLYVSEDGGKNWQMRPLPFPNTAGTGTLAVHPLMPNVILAHIVDYGAGGGILESLDGGSSWHWAFVFGPVNCYAIEFDSANPNIIYAGGSSSSARQSGGVYKSTDGGMNWSFFSISKSTTNIIRALAIDPVNAANLYAGTDDGGVYKSNDGGRKWKAFNSGLTNLSVSELAFDLSGRFLHAATEAGVFSVRVREDSPTSASATISRTIADGAGARVAGAVINLGGTQNRKTITDANGSYRFDNVDTGGFYTVTPSRLNYRFEPDNRSFSGGRSDFFSSSRSIASTQTRDGVFVGFSALISAE